MKKSVLKIASLVTASFLTVMAMSCEKEVKTVTPTFLNPIYRTFSSNSATRKGEADPWIYKHTDGYYYYTATYSDFDRVIIRKAKNINQIDSSDATQEATILTANSGVLAGKVYKYIWAPELHYINGTWYLFFTGSDSSSSVWIVRSHVAKCTDADPLTGTWELCGKVQAVTGDTFDSSSNIMTAFNLDATVFKQNGQWYYVWAQYLYQDGWADENKTSDGILTVNGKDYIDGAGANGGWSSILIGKVVEGSDFTQITNATVISIPEYEWEYGEANYDENGNIGTYTHTSANVNVNEGPAILQRNGKVFIVYSASACDESYCLGMLTADENADFCDMSSWKKSEEPVFTTSVGKSVYGPGHCSFTTYNGWDVIVYHARPYPGLYSYIGRTTNYTSTTDGLSDPYRSGRAKVFTWNADGTPNFGEAE